MNRRESEILYAAADAYERIAAINLANDQAYKEAIYMMRQCWYFAGVARGRGC